jgi:hypothetical protein
LQVTKKNFFFLVLLHRTATEVRLSAVTRGAFALEEVEAEDFSELGIQSEVFDTGRTDLFHGDHGTVITGTKDRETPLQYETAVMKLNHQHNNNRRITRGKKKKIAIVPILRLIVIFFFSVCHYHRHYRKTILLYGWHSCKKASDQQAQLACAVTTHRPCQRLAPDHQRRQAVSRNPQSSDASANPLASFRP